MGDGRLESISLRLLLRSTISHLQKTLADQARQYGTPRIPRCSFEDSKLQLARTFMDAKRYLKRVKRVAAWMKKHIKAVERVKAFYRDRNRVYRNTARFLKAVSDKQLIELRSAPFAVELSSSLLHFGVYPDFPLCGFYPPLAPLNEDRLQTLLRHRLLLTDVPPHLTLECGLCRLQRGYVKVTYPQCYTVSLVVYADNPLIERIEMASIRWGVKDLAYLVKGEFQDRERLPLLEHLNALIRPKPPSEAIAVVDAFLHTKAQYYVLTSLLTQARVLQSSIFAGTIKKIDYVKDRYLQVHYWGSVRSPFPSEAFLRFEVKGTLLEVGHCSAGQTTELDFDANVVDLATVLDSSLREHVQLRLKSIYSECVSHFGEAMDTDLPAENAVRLGPCSVDVFVFGGWSVRIAVKYETGGIEIQVGKALPTAWALGIEKLWDQWRDVRARVLRECLDAYVETRGLSWVAHPLQYTPGYYSDLHECSRMILDEPAPTSFSLALTLAQICPAATNHLWTFALRLVLPLSTLLESRVDDLTPSLDFGVFENQIEVRSLSIPKRSGDTLLHALWAAIDKCEKAIALLCFPILCQVNPDFNESIWTTGRLDFPYVRPNASNPMSVTVRKGVIRIVLAEFSPSFAFTDAERASAVSRSAHTITSSVTMDGKKGTLEFVMDFGRMFHRKGRMSKQCIEKLEQILDSFRVHQAAVGIPLSAKLEGTVVQELSHEAAVLRLKDSGVTVKTSIERVAKGQRKAFYVSATSTPRLTTAVLAEELSYLGDKVTADAVVRDLAVSAQMQLCLSDALEHYAELAEIEYNRDSYDTCGFRVIPTFFCQVSLTYMKSCIVKLIARPACAIEIYEPRLARLTPMDKFVDMLHHCFKRTVGNDKELQSAKNTVDVSKPLSVHLLELRKPHYLSESLLVILEFLNIHYILKATRAAVALTLRDLYADAAKLALPAERLEVSVQLTDRRLTTLGTCDWTVRLELNRGNFPQILKLALSIKGSEQCSETVQTFFNSTVRRISMSSPQYLINWFQVLVLPVNIVRAFARLMAASDRVEVRYEKLVLQREEVCVPVKCGTKVVRLRVLGGAGSERAEVQGVAVPSLEEIVVAVEREGLGLAEQQLH